MWAGIRQPTEGLNKTEGRGRRNSPLFSASLLELGHCLSSSSALELGVVSLAPLVLRYSDLVWTIPLAFLGFPLADSKLQNFSASIITINQSINLPSSSSMRSVSLKNANVTFNFIRDYVSLLPAQVYVSNPWDTTHSCVCLKGKFKTMITEW